jgi:starch synthase
MSLIEAMACGIPAIGTYSGAIPEIVEDSGILCPTERLRFSGGRAKKPDRGRCAAGRACTRPDGIAPRDCSDWTGLAAEMSTVYRRVGTTYLKQGV